MKTPMDLNSTHFTSYHEINVENIDIIEDAWDLNKDYHDVITLLRMFRIEPGERLINKLVGRIRASGR
jgi:hypothetical protein